MFTSQIKQLVEISQQTLFNRSHKKGNGCGKGTFREEGVAEWEEFKSEEVCVKVIKVHFIHL